MNSTALTVLMAAAKEMGSQVHRSNLLGTDNEQQGYVIAFDCLLARKQITDFAEEYHLIGGKPSLSAEAMLARFRRSGGSHRVVTRTGDCAEIELTMNGQTEMGRITWEEAQGEAFVYQGKEKEVVAALAAGGEAKDKLKLKVAYATAYRRKQQLWARVVSDTVRCFAPEMIVGFYTHEEMADLAGTELPTSLVRSAQGSLEDASGAATEVVSERCNPNQAKLIKGLFEKLQLDGDAVVEVLNKRSVGVVEDLTNEQAAQLIQSLDGAVSSQAESEADKQVINVHGPMTQDLDGMIRNKMQEISQSDGGLDICQRVQEKLQESGITLSDLTYDAGRNLLAVLEGKGAEQFFDSELKRASEGNVRQAA